MIHKRSLQLIVLLLFCLIGGCSQVSTLTVRNIELDNGNNSCRLKAKNKSFEAVVEKLANNIDAEIALAESIDGSKKVSANIKGDDCNQVLEAFVKVQKLVLEKKSPESFLLLTPERQSNP